MPSMKHLEMAAAVSAHQHIAMQKSLFGLLQKPVYQPTQSPLRVIVNEYTPIEGEHLEHLLELPLDKLEAALKSKGKPMPAAIGHYRLEACLSSDRRFCALQLFRFADFKNNAVFDVRFYEGQDAETISQLF